VTVRRPVAILVGFLAVLMAGAVARGEVIQKGDLRVAFSARLSPRSLPRQDMAPVSVSIGGRIGTTDGRMPPQLRRIAIAINRDGALDLRHLPACLLDDIQPSNNENALEACRASLVGEGTFSADVKLPEQSPFPSRGKVLAFNGTVHGRPALLAHVYGSEPGPTSYTLPFMITRTKGTFGTLLEASLPQITSDWGFVTGIELDLNRRFNVDGEAHGYLSARCAAPPGFPGAVFPLIRASFAFAHRTMTSTLTRSCKAR
jgi:hypothetical protein